MGFREVADDFIGNNSQRKVVENPASVILQVRAWTNGEPYLTKLILSLILEKDFHISNGQEKLSVSDFVNENIIDGWEQNNASSHLESIRSEILRYPAKHKILLKIYSIILAKEGIPLDDSTEVEKLIATPLVVEREGRLRIQNAIYEDVFNQAWVEKELSIATDKSASDSDSDSGLPLSHEVQRSQQVNSRKESSEESSEEGSEESSRKFLSRVDPRILSAAIVGILALLGFFLFTNRQTQRIAANNGETIENSEGTILNRNNGSSGRQDINFGISAGERTLIPKEELSQENLSFQAQKRKGVEAMAAGKYEEAIARFEEALVYYRNAPETVIYLNNARILAEDPEESYTLAAVVPIANDLPSAQGMLRGIAQAQSRLNQNGGINGVPLKIAIVDDGGEVEQVAQVAEAIAQQTEILGVVGHLYSGMTLGAADTYKENGLSIIALSSSVEISKIDNEYIFRTSPSDAVVAKALAEHMRNQWQEETVAVFYTAGSSYSESLKGEFVTTVLLSGGKVLSEVNWNKDSFNPQRALEQVVDQGAEVLMLVPAELDQLETIAIPMAQANFRLEKPLKIMGGDVVYSDTTLTEEFEGAVVGAFWHIDAADPNSEFIIQSKQMWNAEVSWITAMSYDATQAWIEALERSDTQPTRGSLQKILSSSDGFFSAPGASEDIHFVETGDRSIAGQLVEVVRDEISGEYSFEPVLVD